MVSAPAPGLEYAGFHRLRPGRIHVYCPACRRKLSNMPRTDEDPATAVLVAVACEECSAGCKVDGPDFYRDAEGREVCSYCGKTDCDKVGGRRDCDERLIEAAVARATDKAWLGR